jgi:hypothetical protein
VILYELTGRLVMPGGAVAVRWCVWATSPDVARATSGPERVDTCELAPGLVHAPYEASLPWYERSPVAALRGAANA